MVFIVFVYVLDQFKDSFIILFGFDKFKHNSYISFIDAKVMINLVSMQIVIVFHKFLSNAIKLIKIVIFKLLTIKFNPVPKIVVFDICSYVYMKFVYYIFVKNIKVRCLIFILLSRRIFKLAILELYKRVLKVLKKSAIIGNC